MGCDDEHGLFAAVKCEEQIGDGRGGMVIEAAGGLITEQETRLVDKSASNGDALAFPAGEFGRAVLQALCQTDGGEEVLGAAGAVYLL